MNLKWLAEIVHSNPAWINPVTAEKLGIDPIELRLKNAMLEGDEIPGAQYLSQGLGRSGDENFELLTTPVLQQNETYIAFLEEWRFQDDGAPNDYPATICFDVSFSPTP